jgi:hypothetical protein
MLFNAVFGRRQVIPKSRRTDNIQMLADALGDDYVGLAPHGPAGQRGLIHSQRLRRPRSRFTAPRARSASSTAPRSTREWTPWRSTRASRSAAASTTTSSRGRATVRTRLGRLSAFRVLQNKSSLHGGFVWARRALNSHFRWFLARAVMDANGVLRTGNGLPLSDSPPRSLAPRRLVESEDPEVSGSPPTQADPRQHCAGRAAQYK